MSEGRANGKSEEVKMSDLQLAAAPKQEASGKREKWEGAEPFQGPWAVLKGMDADLNLV